MQFSRKTPIGIGIPDFLFSSTKERRKQIEKQSTPVIFDIAYTPYKLPKNATPRELETHRKNRAFFDLSGENNLYKYMTTEGKVYGNEAAKFTMLQYLQKSTGVFNQNGMLSKEEVKAIKARANDGEKNLWHGFISFNKEDSKLIDTPEKCIDLVKRTFNQFFRDAGFDPDNMDLLCALHLDRPEHLHIHYLFFEKEPKIKNKRAKGYLYRKKGKISFEAIEKMTERLNAFTLNDELEEKRLAVHDALLRKSPAYSTAVMNDIARDMLKDLADKLPRDKPLWYASKEMIPYRSDIDYAARWLLSSNPEALDADQAFQKELRQKKIRLQDKMGGWYRKQVDRELHIVENMEGYTELGDGMKHLYTIEAIEWDYKRRLGNIVLRQVRRIQDERYKPKYRPYKVNDKALKRNLTISARKIQRLNEGFFASLGELFTPHISTCHNRLQEIEKEIEYEKKQEEAKEKQAEEERIRQEAIRRAKYDWSK